jgi:hypothetical protein
MSRNNGMNSIETLAVSSVCNADITEVAEGSVHYCCMNSSYCMIKIICDILLLWRCRLQLVGGHNTGAVVCRHDGTLGLPPRHVKQPKSPPSPANRMAVSLEGRASHLSRDLEGRLIRGTFPLT